MIPKHFTLVGENDSSYELHDSRDDRRFHVAKKGIDLAMHGKLSKIKKFSDGGEVKKPKEGDEAPAGYGKTLGGRIGYPGAEKYVKLDQKPQGYASGGGVAGVSEFDPAFPVPPPSDVPAEPFEHVIPGSPMGLMAMSGAGGGMQTAPTLPPAATAELPPAPEAMLPPSAVAPVAQVQDPLLTRPMNANAALDVEKTALLAGAEAESKAGADTAAAYGKLAKDLEATMTPQEIQAKHQAADDSLMKAYLSKTIDPDHYWNSKSTGGKIAAGIGLILGGLGSGIKGGPNLALETINGAINRDMEAQRTDQSQAMNLWKMNREATQNDIQANLATQNQMLMAVKAKAVQYASAATGPQAQARLAPVIAGIDQQMGQNNFHRSMLSASSTGQTMSTDPSMLLNLVPEKDRHLAAKEIADSKNYAQSYAHVMDTFDKIKNTNTLANMATSPLQTKRQVDAMRGMISFALAKMSGSGQLSDEERKIAEGSLSGLGENSVTDSVKMKNIQSIMQKSKPQATIFKGATGIDLDRFQSTSAQEKLDPATEQRQAEMTYAVQNANSPDPAVRARVAFVRQKHGM